MDWGILILGVPAILIPLVLLFGFAGCAQVAGTCAGDRDCPIGTQCIDGSCVVVGEPGEPFFALSPPENLVAISLNDHSVFLAWSDNDPAATRFQIERALDGDEPQPITLSGTISPTGTTDDSLGLQEGVTYVYQVRAQGDGLPDSDPSDISSATVLPATPVSFTATPAGITHINLSWTNVSAVATEFSLDRRALPGAAITPILLPDPTSTTFSDSERTGLVDGTTYEYRVFATVNGVENGVGQLVKSLPALQSATTPVPTAAFTAPPGTFTTDQASAAGEGICLLQRFSPTLLVPNVTGTQVRLTLRGANSGSLTLDRITISRVGNTGDPYDSATDLTDLVPVGVVTTIAAGGTATVGPVNYNFDSNQDLLVAVDISNTLNQGNLRFGALNGTDTYARTATAEAGVQDRGPNYITAANNLFLIEKIEVL
jgi:hypothetical protein